MRKLMAVAMLGLAGVGGMLGQRTVTEVPGPAKPNDASPNSDKVPDAYAIMSPVQRVAIIRLKHDTDLLEGIRKVVAEQKIKNGVFMSVIGSVRNYHFHAVANRTFPPKDVFIKNPTEPADIIGFSGYVIDGRVHAHMTLSTAQGAMGGHLEPGTNVFTFAVVTVGVLSDRIDLTKVDDWSYR